MTCRYVMPFARNCRILLENNGDQLVKLSGNVLPLDLAWNDDRSMHFRARWRVDHDLVADGGRVRKTFRSCWLRATESTSVRPSCC